MKRPRIAGLCLVSMFMMGMALTGSASAAPLWALCREGPGLTKYSTKGCTKAESTGKWQEVGVQEGTTVKGTDFTLTLEDEKTPLGKTVVRCDSGGELEGEVSSGGKAIIKKSTVKNASTNCKGIEGACESNKIESVEGVDLPWRTELYETEGSFQDSELADGNGEPGWSVKCNTILGPKTDTCTYESGKTEVLSVRPVISDVLGVPVFLVEITRLRRGRGKCTEGGTGAGTEEGQGDFSASNGEGLSVLPF